ncbi:hypothetical protein J2X31_000741 [Flavobacterium arsenatis]|uniref:Lipoprotein n=1 Tax=Flavobacterium arsenatis TaxID=1484332 RepID=A0ABU1TMU3_9FLAO|nr:hypothetical protein [Flavobacterium arsenatis]MDR6966743.1 hypothetical protein [Flavobacterium arsenatis]
MKKVFLLGFLSILFVSCNSKTEYQTITVDNKYSLEIPDFMSEAKNLNTEASLQYQNVLREFYVIVLDEPKTEFPNQEAINLEEYKNIVLENLKMNLSEPTISPVEDTIINGLKAKLFSVSDNTENIEIYYQFAYIESNSHFYQIMTWTLENRKDKFSLDMDKIIASFKEIESKNRSK